MRTTSLGILLMVVAGLLGLSVLVYLVSPEDGSRADPPDAEGRAAVGVPAEAEHARVVSHVDGDTIRLTARGRSDLLPEAETTVRLLEIDTPEHGRDGEPPECYADEASRALREALPTGADVWVASDEDLHDPYGRTLLYLWEGDGDFVNLELVRQGYARAVLFEPNDAYIDDMRRAESEARAAGRGMWGAC